MKSYYDRLVEEAAKLREAHGGNKQWWVRHPRDCPHCLRIKGRTR
jgi:hypothetical protein